MFNKLGFIFPCAGVEQSGQEKIFFQRFEKTLKKRLQTGSEITGCNLNEILFGAKAASLDELPGQYAAYSFSCGVGELLMKNGVIPQCTAGYSMGLYAAAFCSGALSFEDGLVLIRESYNLMREACRRKRYGMGVIIGLSEAEVNKLINASTEGVEIINVNNKHSMVISGVEEGIDKVLAASAGEGALSLIKLPISLPYHSKYLLPMEEKFADCVRQVRLKDPRYPLVSSIDSRVMDRKEQIKSGLIKNIVSKLSWLETMRQMADCGVNTFFEVGSGLSLTKMMKFMELKSKIYNIKNYEDYCKLN